MERAWCTNCKTNVSLIHATNELPCPSCSSVSYMVLRFDASISLEDTDLKAEQLMQRSMWDEAAEAYRSCSDIEPSEFNLRMATLELRRDCSQQIHNVIVDNGGTLDIADLRQYLVDNYDTFISKWILQEYRGILLVPNGTSYFVQWRDGK